MSNDDNIDPELRKMAQALSYTNRSDSDNRGLFWNRIRTESSHLEVRQMASAAKGDNT